MDQNFDIDVADLNLEDVEITSVEDSAALPEGSASYKSSSTCVILL